MIGGCLGLLLALWISDVVIKLNPGTLVRLEEINLDSNVLIFTTLVSILSGLIFGLIPAMRASSGDVFTLLKDGSRTAGRKGHHRFRSIMVISELMLALLLLVGGGLLLRSFYALLNIDPGFKSENLLTMNFSLPPDRYREIPRRTVLLDQLEERMLAIPGVEEVGMNNVLPFGESALLHSMSFEGRQMPPGTEPEIGSRTINPAYFKTMQIPLIAGRYFNNEDRENSQKVGIINQSMARKYYPNDNPIGKRVKWSRLPDSEWMTIVGVVGNVRVYDLLQEEDPAIYTPYAQETSWWKTWTNLVVRTKTDQAAIVGAAKKEMAKLDAMVPLEDIRTMKESIELSIADRKFQLILLGAFSALAFFLAVIGLYGVISYLVSERTRDFGVRMALGAQPVDILKLVLGQAMRLAGAGVVAGVVLSIGLTRLLKSMLVGVKAIDPLTIAAVAIVLAAVSIAASYFPARRATKVDPVTALRYE
jgi:putative ABC transport system permease protein